MDDKLPDTKTGAKYIYEYHFNTQRYIFSSELGNGNYVKLGGNSGNGTCETLDSRYSWGRKAISMTDQDVGTSASTETNHSLGG